MQMKKKTGFFLMLMFTLSLMLSSCGERETHVSVPESVVVAENDESYFDSKDQAVVYKINKILKTITFYNYDLAKSYTLSYDGITSFYDKYGTAVSVEQLREGAIADIEFLKLSKKLVTLKESSDTFRYEALTGFSINEEKKTFTYRDEVYNPASPEKGTAEIIVAKQRNGPTGIVKLQWEASLTQFRNLAMQVHSDLPNDL